MPDKRKVSVGKPKVGGALYWAPPTAIAPTDASTDLPNDFLELGYASQDGFRKAINRETTDIKAWGGDIVYNATSSYGETYTVTLIEALSANVQKFAHGDANVTGSLASGLTVVGNSAELDEGIFVCEEILTGGTLKRTVLPVAKPTAVGEVTDNDSNVIGYTMTITATPDAAGNYSYTYYKEG